MSHRKVSPQVRKYWLTRVVEGRHVDPNDTVTKGSLELLREEGYIIRVGTFYALTLQGWTDLYGDTP